VSLLGRLFGEFVDVIDWVDDSRDTMVWRFPRHGNEIKFGAKLTVREGQTAIFVNEGQVADVLGPGMYELDTQNLPVLSTLQAWPHAFESPFKAEVYFCNTRRFTDLKWGTRNPLMMRDAEFGPIRCSRNTALKCRISRSKTSRCRRPLKRLSTSAQAWGLSAIWVSISVISLQPQWKRLPRTRAVLRTWA